MQVIFFVFVFTFFGGAFAAPKETWHDSSSYSEFDDGFPFGYTGAFAGAGAAGAAAGAWPYPSYPSYGFFNPFFPFTWPVFKPIIPWYKGDNVCTEEQTVDEPEKVQSWFKDGRSRQGVKRQSENCEGDNDSYTCSKRLITGNGSKIIYTRYQCCAGHIRDPRGPGCIKKSSDDDATATDAPTAPVKSEYHRSAGDRVSYVFSSSNRDTTRGSDVEKVPPQ